MNVRIIRRVAAPKIRVILAPRYTLPVPTFFIQTLGCKVNQYESEQVAALLRARGWSAAPAADAELRIVNSCSVTAEAGHKSRQAVGRMVRLTVRGENTAAPPGQRTLVMGCWATSDRAQAEQIRGVDAVLTHHDDVAARLESILEDWQDQTRPTARSRTPGTSPAPARPAQGTVALPLLEERQGRGQRAFLKIQDGCDAHCTYCIIPKLRPRPWSKPVDDAVEEAKRLVAAGHAEIILTGIFLGAFGHPTALRRRQENAAGGSLARLVDALCTRVPNLRRLRLSSLEPGDLGEQLVATLASHPQVVPHFHLPLQSGSDRILRRMNRQYSRDDYRRMLDRVRSAFDRPAITTDIIVGFPGEDDDAFAQSVEMAEQAGFIHIHAFPFSPRPGTAAARWARDFVPPALARTRIAALSDIAARRSMDFRRQFVGEPVQVLVERTQAGEGNPAATRHGRCERYFDVEFEAPCAKPGDLLPVRIQRIAGERTFGVVLP